MRVLRGVGSVNAPHPPSSGHGLEGHAIHFDHVLIVGGTGMLAGATDWCIARAPMTTVLARRATTFASSRPAAKAARIDPIAVDYHDAEALHTQLRKALARHGRPDLVVTWIHSSAPSAFDTIAAEVAAAPPPASHTGSVDVIRVLSSAYADPSRGAHLTPRSLSDNPQLRGHAVVLGFVIEGTASRWLTNAEISQGVIDAIHRARHEPYGAHHELDMVPITVPVSIVGTIEPWNRRPA